jgi:CHAT domain-containing protein
MRATGVLVLLLLAQAGSAADKKDELTPQRRQELVKKIEELTAEGVRQYQRGDYVKAKEVLRGALEMCRALYPKEQYPNGHPDLATSISNLALMHQAAEEYGKAEPLYREALAMYRALYPRGDPDFAATINNLALLHRDTGEYGKAEPLLKEALEMRRALYPKERYPRGHPDLATSINNLAALHEAAGEYGKAEPLFKEALAMDRASYPKERYPKGHRNLATSINNLAFLHQAAGEYGKAEPLFKEALEMCRALYPKERYPKGHPDLAMSINNLAGLRKVAGEYGKAEPLFKEALDMCRALFPKEQYPRGHPLLTATIINLASLHRDAGEYGKAEPLFKEALDMCRALYPKEQFPKGHPNLATSLNSLASLHRDAGEYGKAEPLYQEALAMCRALYPKEQFPRGHPLLAATIINLASLHRDAGEYGKAEPLFREALAMCRALFPKEQFPKGHPNLATSLNSLAALHRDAGEYGKAEPLYQEALEMCRALYPKERYPKGHPDLAATINNLAMLHYAAGEYGKAEPLFKEALEMCRALYPKERYPKGHPDIAATINNLAALHEAAGEYGKAEPLFKEALEMCRALYPKERYPKGHPLLASGLNNLAGLHLYAGEYDKAEPLFKEALDMYGDLAWRYADLVGEAEALNFLATQPLARDALLSASRHRPGTATYDAVWSDGAALTRLQQRRHRDLMASRDSDARDLGRQLTDARQRLAALLLHPLPDPAEHRKEVQKRTDAKEELEKRLARQLHLDAPPTDSRDLTPRRLSELLPGGAAFIDLLRYGDFEQDPKVPGLKGQKYTPRYVAFVLRKGKPAARVELKEAAPIDAAWAAWHKAITAKDPDDKAEREAAAAFARLVWQPLRDALPDDLHTAYLAAEGPLSQVPWGALPGEKPDTLLLDQCAVCLVPHGPFLLERLQEKAAPSRSGDTAVVYGGVDYAGEPKAVVKDDDVRAPLLGKRRVVWPELPGTARELEQVAQVAGKALKDRPIVRSGAAASTAQLLEDLPRARYAHLATHGFFAGPEFRSALQLRPEDFHRLTLERRAGAARSPLVLSGLVLAGANREGKDALPDRGIITAEGLIALPLEGLELAVLSACETGVQGDVPVGEAGGGEGVYGLQRAFHVAGCRNVIASLWKVDDGATQALMALFYRNLWERKLDAAEALRQAQLTLYRHPEAVEVARKRGQDFSESDLPRVAEKPAEKPKRSPAAHWAAFTFSGVRPGPKPESK